MMANSFSSDNKIFAKNNTIVHFVLNFLIFDKLYFQYASVKLGAVSRLFVNCRQATKMACIWFCQLAVGPPDMH